MSVSVSVSVSVSLVGFARIKTDAARGRYYDANLEKPPFGLAPARSWVHDRKYGVDSQHPMAVWESRRYGPKGPPSTHPSEKYMGLWNFDDVPSFED